MAAEPSRHEARGEGIDAEASTAIVEEDIPEDVLLHQAESTARQTARRDFKEAVDAMPQSLAEAAQRVETVLRYEAERVYDRMSEDLETPWARMRSMTSDTTYSVMPWRRSTWWDFKDCPRPSGSMFPSRFVAGPCGGQSPERTVCRRTRTHARDELNSTGGGRPRSTTSHKDSKDRSEP